MSSIAPKEVLAKNLQKSHSSSSLLLSSANLAWTPTSSAILVTPQPVVERPLSRPSSESSKALTNEEIIQSLRSDDSAATSNQSLDVLEGFQTISLNDTKAEDQRSVDSVASNASNQSAPTSKPSLLDKLFSPIATTIGRTSGRSSPQNSEPNQLTAPTLSSQTQLSSNIGFSSHLSASQSSPNLGFVPNSDHTVTRGSSVEPVPSDPVPTQLPPPPPPQMPPPPPSQPPKGFAPKDYKLRGPLRLYDPTHGIDQSNVAPNASQPSAPVFTAPVVNSKVESIFDPTDLIPNNQPPPEAYVSSVEFIDLSARTQTGQQLEPTVPTSDQNQCYDWQQNLNSQQFSFISEGQPQEIHSFNPNANDWTASGQTTQHSYSNYQYYPSMDTHYQPVEHHWFYQKIIENKEVWLPFSMYDSYNLEQALLSSGNGGYGVVIPTNGGRFDVSIYDRLRRPIYWTEEDTIVRRCSWFYKREGHNRWSPYPEDFSAKLEEAYRLAMVNNNWNQTVDLEVGTEVVIMHSQTSIWHYQKDHALPDGWGQAVENPNKPRLVHRGGLDGIFDDIDEGEPEKIDHLVFLVHGIGEWCDLRFRSIVEVVDDFRAISLSQMRTHFKSYLESGQLGRIELLPISWHSALHGEETGIDDQLKHITLESIPKLRHFSNDTILDALFYTSPVYCQTIVDSVGQELNRLFSLFCQRNPHFAGSVALGGHSLGSLIVFDILAHQKPFTPSSYLNAVDSQTNDKQEYSDGQQLMSDTRRLSHSSNHSSHHSGLITTELNSPVNNYPFEAIGLGFPAIKYPTLCFHPSAFFAMGSPIPMFLTVRGVQNLSPDYRLPTCAAVFNIFHPYDPIAYRLEPMIYKWLKDVKPVLIPHHKGRKRMHLELRDSIVRMGSDLKSKIYDSLKYTWNSIHEFARAHKPTDASASGDETNNETNGINDDQNQNNYSINADYEDSYGQSMSAGALNSGRRIDHVLQESPVEAFNEYVFAIRAHTCYWQSEDTALLILRELYGQMGYYSTQPTTTSSGPPMPDIEQQALSPNASTHSLAYSDGTEQQYKNN